MKNPAIAARREINQSRTESLRTAVKIDSFHRRKLTGQKHTGRGTNYYFTDEDRQRARDLGAWLMSQGIRASESLVLKAALRLAEPNALFLDSARELMQEDRRFRRA